jgi:hypothetical protein
MRRVISEVGLVLKRLNPLIWIGLSLPFAIYSFIYDNKYDGDEFYYYKFAGLAGKAVQGSWFSLPGWTLTYDATYPMAYPFGAGIYFKIFHLIANIIKSENRIGIAWAILIVATTLISIILLWRTKATGRAIAITYLLVSIAILRIMYTHRIEPLAITLTIAGLIAFIRHREAKSGLLLTFAGFVKVWPLALVISMGIFFRRWKLLATTSIFIISVTLLGFATHGRPWAWLAFANKRPLKIESFSALPGLYRIYLGSHSYNRVLFFGDCLSGPYLQSIYHLLLILVGTSIAIIGWKARSILTSPRITETHLAFLLAVTLGELISNPVLSGQYLSWLTPIICIALLFNTLAIEAFLCFAATLLTGIFYPYQYGGIRTGIPQLSSLTILSLRDLFLVFAFIIALHRVATTKEPKNLELASKDKKRKMRFCSLHIR